MRPVHLHSEQFDGHLHAVCGAGDWFPPNSRCVSGDAFEAVARISRCRRCAAYWWPMGGEPVDGHSQD